MQCTIRIFSKLARPAQGMLLFEDLDNNQLYKTQFPVVWKYIYFPTGHGSTTVAYHENFIVFCAGTVTSSVDGDHITSDVWVDAKHGESWELTNVDNTLSLVKAKQNDRRNKSVHVRNEAGGRHDIGFGFNTDNRASLVVVQQGVGHKQAAVFEFKPVLKIWLSDGTKRSGVLHEKVEQLLLWEGELGKKERITLELVESSDSSYRINEVEEQLSSMANLLELDN